jgi:hypothetical protein
MRRSLYCCCCCFISWQFSSRHLSRWRSKKEAMKNSSGKKKILENEYKFLRECVSPSTIVFIHQRCQ